MPGAGSPANSLSEYINEIQARLMQELLSKVDASRIYSTKSDVTTINQITLENEAEIKISDSETSGILSTASSLAPAGLRDTWQIPPGLSFNGGYVTHFPGPDILYAGGSSDVKYSLDGGVTFASINYDIQPISDLLFIIGYDGVDKFVLIAYDAEDTSYTSTDGINFVSSGHSIGGNPYSYRLLWVARLGLWIASIRFSETHGIGTSPDGLTWTPRATPWDIESDVNGNVLIDSGNLLVLVGTGAAWSNDGITWYPGSGISTYQQAGCYSPDRDEYIVCGESANEVYKSKDGKIWTSLGSIGQNGVISMIWVGEDIQRYYLARVYSINTNSIYSIWTTPDPSVQPFATTAMKGAIVSKMSYSSVLYDSARKRFVIGIDSLGVAYSTNTPYVIKSMSDDINVCGAPVHTDQYSTYADIKCENTTALTDISTSASSIGSLRYPSNLYVGQCINFAVRIAATSSAGDTLTIAFRLNGTSFISHAITIPPASSNTPIHVNCTVAIRETTFEADSERKIGTATALVYAGAVVLDRTIPNTFSVSAQWGANVNQMRVTRLTVDNTFRRGR